MAVRQPNLCLVSDAGKTDFEKLVAEDWLSAFLQYSSYGECTPRIMFWVGVSTLASVLQRKVWIDQGDFQWSPNFYILVVGEQGVVRKSTSIDVGMRLAKQVMGVQIGPSAATWASFLKKLSESGQSVTMPQGGTFTQSCLTLALSEFGTFFKPEDNEMIDGLTDLWDNKLETFEKLTIARGMESVQNPWINLIAATTPKWVQRNLTENLIGGGLLSRFVFLHGEMPDIDIAYPKRGMPKERLVQSKMLIDRLAEIGDFAGEVEVTEEAMDWGDDWYKGERNLLRSGSLSSMDYGFRARKQGHLHKLAAILAASRGRPERIEVEDLKGAAGHLDDMEEDARRVLGNVGITKITGCAKQIVEAVRKRGPVKKFALYREVMGRFEIREFDEAVQCAVKAQIISVSGSDVDPVLTVRDGKK